MRRRGAKPPQTAYLTTPALTVGGSRLKCPFLGARGACRIPRRRRHRWKRAVGSPFQVLRSSNEQHVTALRGPDGPLLRPSLALWGAALASPPAHSSVDGAPAPRVGAARAAVSPSAAGTVSAPHHRAHATRWGPHFHTLRARNDRSCLGPCGRGRVLSRPRGTAGPVTPPEEAAQEVGTLVTNHGVFCCGRHLTWQRCNVLWRDATGVAQKIPIIRRR